MKIILLVFGLIMVIFFIVIQLTRRFLESDSTTAPEICPKCKSRNQKSSFEERSRFHGRSMGHYTMTIEVIRCTNCGEELWESKTGTGGYWDH